MPIHHNPTLCSYSLDHLQKVWSDTTKDYYKMQEMCQNEEELGPGRSSSEHDAAHRSSFSDPQSNQHSIQTKQNQYSRSYNNSQRRTKEKGG